MKELIREFNHQYKISNKKFKMVIKEQAGNKKCDSLNDRFKILYNLIMNGPKPADKVEVKEEE
ncbi:MAG: hypothetical protein RBR68_07290 [Tenuifilaceae bacterium]|nr:hypothetical protein [Tenuifilaceae bacterium]